MTDETKEEQRVDDDGPGSGEAGRVSDPEKRDLNWHLERIWNELKELTRQVEDETRRGGRIAKLRFEIRGRRQEFESEAARVGELVYEAQMTGGKRPALARVDGYDECVEKMAALRGEIEAKQEEIATLRGQTEASAED